MIYAIGVESKRHAIYTKGAPLGTEDFRLVNADDDGWIEWNGGECPLPGGSPVVVRRKDGLDVHRKAAQCLYWGSANDSGWEESENGFVIIAYRPILSEPEAPEWDGEGLPPVGCECECYIPSRGVWAKVKIVAHDGDVAIFKNGVGHLYAGALSDQFRPIRSEEDRAVDEMARIIADGHDVYIGAHEAAERIYRAGYRKTGDE